MIHGNSSVVSTVEVASGKRSDDAYARGRDVYNYRCYFCHGYSGDAKTVATSYLSPPPRDFTSVDPATLTRDQMIEAVTHGRAGSAMMAFAAVLDEGDIAAVVDFIRFAFMGGEQANTRYHTAANGWPNHERYAAAFPFATGELLLSVSWEQLSPEQQRGRELFMSACITCHDRANVDANQQIWNRQSTSYPRGGYAPGGAVDSVGGASPYGQHDIPPVHFNLTAQEARGEALYQQNCAFCHAADGTGKNWIGSFLQPHPRNLTDGHAMRGMTRERLVGVITVGLPGTTMPAWRDVLQDDEIEAVAAYVMRAFVRRPH